MVDRMGTIWFCLAGRTTLRTVPWDGPAGRSLLSAVSSAGALVVAFPNGTARRRGRPCRAGVVEVGREFEPCVGV